VIECLGRIDHQVKVNGHRIELGDVEAALATYPAVTAAAARVWGEPPKLVAYIVPRAGEPRTPESIRQHVRERLPGYMVPALLTFVDTLPLTPNGKVDRRALPDPAPSAPERTLTPPRTDAERDVLAVWTEVFGRAEFGITDDFFELGGTSLQAGEIIALIRKQLGHTIPLASMYTATTVEKLAALIQHRLEGASSAALVPLQSGGSRPPLFMIAGIGGHVFTFHKFARMLGPDYPVYGVKAIGVDDGRKPPESFEEIAAEYVKEITAACPHGPYLLSGYSIGAHVAIEVALQLQALGHEVPLVIVFDMPAPGYPPRLSVPRRLALHVSNLFRRDGGGLQYAVRRFRNLGNRVLRLLGLEKWLFPHHPSLNALPQEALRDVWVSMQRAERKYRPHGRADTSLALFRSEIPLDVWNAVVHTDPHLGWGAYVAGPIDVQLVSRGHLEMFHDDNIESLARRVAGLIDRAADRRASLLSSARPGAGAIAPAC
jgi:thioesterase domain-containing protein/acyl carrier protein